jgi:short-subunit dehydrogenase
MKKVVAITGASGGIGRATALRVARNGASVALCARRKDRLEEVAAEVVRAGGQALPFVADVTRETEVQAFVDRTVSTFGSIDVMMCNAGFGIYGAIDTIDSSRMRALMDVNYFGTYHAVHAVLPVFRRQASGHLIVISSILGRRSVPFTGAYAATKSAQVGLAEAIRAELLGTSIHVTVVYPVSTDTEFFGVMKAHSGFATRAKGPRQSADTVADAIARAMDHPQPEVYPKRIAKGLAVLNTVAPGLTDRIVRRWRREPI